MNKIMRLQLIGGISQALLACNLTNVVTPMIEQSNDFPVDPI
jgi:hypothetical protein